MPHVPEYSLINEKEDASASEEPSSSSIRSEYTSGGSEVAPYPHDKDVDLDSFVPVGSELPLLPQEEPLIQERIGAYRDTFVEVFESSLKLSNLQGAALVLMRTAGQVGLTLQEISEKVGKCKQSVSNELQRFVEQVPQGLVHACELLYLLARYENLRVSRASTLVELEHANPWLHGISRRPALVEFALQHLCKTLAPEYGELQLISSQGETHITTAPKSEFENLSEACEHIAHQSLLMHQSRQQAISAISELAERTGSQEMLHCLLAKSFRGLLVGPDGDPHEGVLLATGLSDEAHMLAVLRLSDTPLPIDEISKRSMVLFGRPLSRQRLSKYGVESLVRYGRGLFGLEAHHPVGDQFLEVFGSSLVDYMSKQPDGTEFTQQELFEALDDGLVRHEHIHEEQSFLIERALRERDDVECLRSGKWTLRLQQKSNTFNRWSLRRQVIRRIEQTRQPMTLEQIKAEFSELLDPNKPVPLKGDDVLIRIGRGIFWVFQLPLPNGIFATIKE